jgi:hypothetical protein
MELVHTIQIMHSVSNFVLLLSGVKDKVTEARSSQRLESVFFVHPRSTRAAVIAIIHSKIIASAQDLRLSSDYDDFYVVNKQDAAQALSDARKFIVKYT